MEETRFTLMKRDQHPMAAQAVRVLRQHGRLWRPNGRSDGAGRTPTRPGGGRANEYLLRWTNDFPFDS